MARHEEPTGVDGARGELRGVHRRQNLLTGDWVLVSPQRLSRPWHGQVDVTAAPAPAFDPECYLCPGNLRAGGHRNPSYGTTFVFDNDFAALRPDVAPQFVNEAELLRARSESGICRVVCYSPRHDASLSDLTAVELRGVIDAWAAEYRALGARPDIRAVTIFENRGATMGASSPHPHGQIWANEMVPDEMLRESDRQREHLKSRGACLLCAYGALELELGRRVVDRNEHFVALVPYWAVWPFETLLLPIHHVVSIDQLDSAGRDGLAAILRSVVGRYDRLFGVPFPYTMGFHQQPTDGGGHPHWHLHGHFYPPLLRSATVRKFMVGYELLASPQRDITPEKAASQLRGIEWFASSR